MCAGTSSNVMNDVLEALEPVVEALEQLGVRYRHVASAPLTAACTTRSGPSAPCTAS